MVFVISEAQVLTPIAHGEQAVRVSAVRAWPAPVPLGVWVPSPRVFPKNARWLGRFKVGHNRSETSSETFMANHWDWHTQKGPMAKPRFCVLGPKEPPSVRLTQRNPPVNGIPPSSLDELFPNIQVARLGIRHPAPDGSRTGSGKTETPAPCVALGDGNGSPHSKPRQFPGVSRHRPVHRPGTGGAAPSGGTVADRRGGRGARIRAPRRGGKAPGRL